MLSYIIRRLLITIPMLFAVITLVFFAFRLLPGDAAVMFAGDQASKEQVEQIRRNLGLDRPLSEQYVTYLAGLARGDLGKSAITRRPVIVEITTRLGNTVRLALAAISVAVVLGLVMGVVAAVKAGTRWDYLISILAVMGISVPVFWLGLLLMLLFSVYFGLLPASGADSWRHYLMPAFCLSVYSIAFITRMTRSTLLEVIGEDYVRTARAKGLSERLVLVRHALRNALLPVITVVGLRLGYMLGGSVITESVFSWPGIGRLFFTSVSQRDAPVVQGVLLIFATGFLLVNLLVDVTYALVDPRIRYH